MWEKRERRKAAKKSFKCLHKTHTHIFPVEQKANKHEKYKKEFLSWFFSNSRIFQNNIL